MIKQKNKINNKSRVVAGYCWDWISKNNPKLSDISIDEFGYKATWNLTSDGSEWIISPKSVEEVGCIHTCQGLEVDYVGVIIGKDLIANDGVLVTDPSARAKTDKSLAGYKKELKEDPISAQIKADEIIRNTYRTLMSRGMKGCYVYFVDKETEKFFKSRIEGVKAAPVTITKKILSPFTIEMIRVPLVGSAPCGNPLLGEENIEEYIEVEKSKIKPGYSYFILRATGDSMNLAGINDGDLVLCRQQLKADTGNRVVALLGDNVSIKEYGPREDGVRLLLPKSSNKDHAPITPGEGDSVQGIVQEVL
jgi:DUF2075 family protein